MLKKLLAPLKGLHQSIMMRRRERCLSQGEPFGRESELLPLTAREALLGTLLAGVSFSAAITLPVPIFVFMTGLYDTGINSGLFAHAGLVYLKFGLLVFALIAALPLLAGPFSQFEPPYYYTANSKIVKEATEVLARIRTLVKGSDFLKDDHEAKATLYASALLHESLMKSYSSWLLSFSEKELKRVHQIRAMKPKEISKSRDPEVKAVHEALDSFREKLDLLHAAELKLLEAQEAAKIKAASVRLKEGSTIALKSSTALLAASTAGPTAQMADALTSLDDVTLSRRSAQKDLKEYLENTLPELSS